MLIRSLSRWLGYVVFAAMFCASAAAQQPDTAVSRLLDQGYALRRANKPDSAARLFEQALVRDSSNVRAAREIGFARLAAGDTLGARNAFRYVVRLAPRARDDQAQLGYLDLSLNDVAGALEAFRAATRVASDDAALTLQLAYTYERLGMHVPAMRAFQTAAILGDVAQRRQSLASLAVLAGEGYAAPGTAVADWYASAQYGTRFNDLIVSALGHAAISLDAASRTQAFVVGRVFRDTRSSGGVQPVVFSDNYATAGVGLRTQPLPLNLTAYAEAGPATTLTRGGKSGLEWRAGLTFGSAWTSAHSPWFGESYADASYYSRYDDAIGYAQLRQLRPVAKVAHWLDASLREELAVDDKGIGYNNLLEGAAGIRIHGGPGATAALYVEYVQDLYTRGRVDGRRTFGELRATMVASGSATFLKR